MFRCGLWASSGPFPLSAHYGLYKRGRDPPQTLAIIWRKKREFSLSSGCSSKIKEGDQPPPLPPPPLPHHHVPPPRPPPYLALIACYLRATFPPPPPPPDRCVVTPLLVAPPRTPVFSPIPSSSAFHQSLLATPSSPGITSSLHHCPGSPSPPFPAASQIPLHNTSAQSQFPLSSLFRRTSTPWNSSSRWPHLRTQSTVCHFPNSHSDIPASTPRYPSPPRSTLFSFPYPASRLFIFPRFISTTFPYPTSPITTQRSLPARLLFPDSLIFSLSPPHITISVVFPELPFPSAHRRIHLLLEIPHDADRHLLIDPQPSLPDAHRSTFGTQLKFHSTILLTSSAVVRRDPTVLHGLTPLPSEIPIPQPWIRSRDPSSAPQVLPKPSCAYGDPSFSPRRPGGFTTISPGESSYRACAILLPFGATHAQPWSTPRQSYASTAIGLPGRTPSSSRGNVPAHAYCPSAHPLRRQLTFSPALIPTATTSPTRFLLAVRSCCIRSASTITTDRARALQVRHSSPSSFVEVYIFFQYFPHPSPPPSDLVRTRD